MVWTGLLGPKAIPGSGLISVMVRGLGNDAAPSSPETEAFLSIDTQILMF